MGIKKEKIINSIKFIFPLLLLIFTFTEMRKFTKDLNVHLLKHELGQLNLGTTLIILAVTFIAVLPMLFYDVILVEIFKFRLPRKELLEQAFIANSFSNLIGFGGIIGAMLRTYFYHKYEKDNRRLLGGIASVSFYYLTGISVLSWFVIIGYNDFFLFRHTRWLYFAVLAVALYLPVFLCIQYLRNKKDNNSLITVEAGVKLIIASVVEWSSVFIAIWILTKILGISISLSSLFPVYIVAACSGIISMIPGGLGSFDLVFIYSMHVLHMQEEKVLVLLLFYRLGYYILPFVVSVILFVRLYWEKWNKLWSNLPKAVLQGVSHIILTFLVFLSGLILLLSASVPGIMSRLRIAQEILSFPIINISHQLSVATGFLLLALSRGIEYSVKRAYDLTMFALILAALFSIFKGIDYEEAIFLIIVALLLRSSRGQFYRESYVLTWGKTIFDITVILIITFMYIFIGYLNLPSARLTMPKKFLPFVIVDYRDLFSSALIGLLIAFLIFFVGYQISKPKKWKWLNSKDCEHELKAHISKYKGNALAHLLFLHDKYIFWNKKGNVLFAFQAYADKLVILGDPIGEKSAFSEAVEEFQAISDLYGFTPVFYQISDLMLPHLQGKGFAFFKLAEEGFVNLNDFQIKADTYKSWKGPPMDDCCRFEVIEPPFSDDLLFELKNISDDWLQGKREKGFSLGYFHEEYLNKAPIALLKNENGEILGFASIMCSFDDKETISVDLLRFRPEQPEEKVHFLIFSFFEWAKLQGYRKFNIGMVPLANVGLSRFALLSEKIAAQIFLHGHFTYRFQSLVTIRENYTDSWDSRYLGYRRKSSLAMTMAQIALLISRKRA